MTNNNEEYVKLMMEETRYYNGLVLPHRLCDTLPHFVVSWLRNCFFSIAIYFLVAFLCLNFWRCHFSTKSMKIMTLQIKQASKAIPLGQALQLGMEYMILKGWTKCYPRVSNVGLGVYLLHLLLYLVLLEFGTYWSHRLIHIYKYIHRAHHLYNKEERLTPFAGFAMHPLESIFMGLSHAMAILIIPTHFKTHIVLLLFQGVWAIFIHDRSDFLNYWPIMNAQYHTIHHTSGNYNFGNFTIFMDQFFGTLRRPKSSSNAKKL